MRNWKTPGGDRGSFDGRWARSPAERLYFNRLFATGAAGGRLFEELSDFDPAQVDNPRFDRLVASALKSSPKILCSYLNPTPVVFNTYQYPFPRGSLGNGQRIPGMLISDAGPSLRAALTP